MVTKTRRKWELRQLFLEINSLIRVQDQFIILQQFSCFGSKVIQIIVVVFL